MLEKFNQYYDLVKREGREELLNYLRSTDYFEAPASTQYHLSSTGGLLEHSINVTDTLFKVSGLLTQGELSDESLAIVGLFHDLGKATYFNKPNYVENILKSGKRSDAKPYETNKTRLNIPHEVASVHILSRFIELTEHETFAILYHNGLYTSTGYSLKGNETEIQMLLHFADLWCSRVIEK